MRRIPNIYMRIESRLRGNIDWHWGHLDKQVLGRNIRGHMSLGCLENVKSEDPHLQVKDGRSELVILHWMLVNVTDA